VSYCIFSTVSCLYILRAVWCWCYVSCCRYSDILYSAFNNGSLCYLHQVWQSFCPHFVCFSVWELWMNFNAVFGGMCCSSWWDFDDDSADTDTFLRKVLPLLLLLLLWKSYIRYTVCESDSSTNLADNCRSCWRLLTKCFDGWDVSLATNLSVSLLIWTMTTSRNV